MESMDPRKKVEATFEKWIMDEDGCLARSDFMEMLTEMLGLRRIDAEELLNLVDPKCQDRLPYKDFLDFIFGSGGHQLGTSLTSTKASSNAEPQAENTEKAENLDKAGVDDDISMNDLDGSKEENAETLKTTASSQVLASENAETMTPEATSPTPDAATPAQEESRAESPVTATPDVSATATPDVSATATPDAVTPADTAEKTDETKARADSAETGSIPAMNACCTCGSQGEIFQDPLDPSDLEMYCEKCWIEYYSNSNGDAPDFSQAHNPTTKLVVVFPSRVWKQSELSKKWMQNLPPGWPPYASRTTPVKDAEPVACPPSGDPKDIPQRPGQNWVDVRVRVIPNLIGPHARECTRRDRPYLREVLGGRYQVEGVCGAGHFTRAFRATDLITHKTVCVKRHNSLTVEILTDMMAIGQRLECVDPAWEFFPRLVDQFFDMNGYTVEMLLEGSNCLDMGRKNPGFFQKMKNLQHVAKGTLKGLELLALAGVVHCDLKPDNIMWTEPSTPDEDPLVRIVDFGCARLDSRVENGRNWSLSEGGAGHLGKWAPEMALRLPITEKADIWGLAVSLLELHCGRAMWSSEDDTVEVILAQALGILNARNGLPIDLLRRSPLDITRLYSPSPSIFPCYRIGDDRNSPLEEYRPAVWGLGQVLGHSSYWDEVKTNLADFVQKAMEMDPEKRPAASVLLNHAYIVGAADPKGETPTESDFKGETTAESDLKGETPTETNAETPTDTKAESEKTESEKKAENDRLGKETIADSFL